jgi:D-alanyl-D-alanine carboxypeptidase
VDSNHSNVLSHFQMHLDEAMDQGIPGLSAAIATSRGIEWVDVAGLANIVSGEPMNAELRFGMGSITKTFVVTVILQVIEEGCLRPNDTVSNLLNQAAAGVPNAQSATVEQLLNRTSGISSWKTDVTWIHHGRGDAPDVNRVWSKEDTLQYIRGRAPLADAGIGYSYSNTNYTLLGLIIERVTGHDVSAELYHRILHPLQLTSVALEGFGDVSPRRLPRRYHVVNAEFRQKCRY